ncbi:TonB-dependent receptor plug domain-containing protein, partial [Chitinimonas sp.]|uniref:TonB-dependent receptor plug domain-containing protein n=1 Tax=Chitinimonas sp. TaxID=1934313 RepID=UPI0035B0117D
MNKKRLSHAISLIGVASLTLAHADEPVQKMERIEVTGSSIKRIAKEGALPVQTLRREDIERSGATTITDLIQNLPAVQGFVAPAASVNGGGGGTA